MKAIFGLFGVFGVAATLLLPALAHAENWDLVDNRPESSIYVDRDSIITDGHIARMWTKTALREPALDPVSKQRYIREFVRWAFDCTNKTGLATTYRHTSDTGKTVWQNSVPAVPSRFEDVPPASLADDFMNIACAAPTPAAAASDAAIPEATTAPVTVPVPAGPHFGTAWVSVTGYAVTAYHLVEGAASIKLVMEGREFTAVVAIGDAANDIAVLRPAWRGHAPQGLALNTDVPRLGMRMLTLGFPQPDKGTAVRLTTVTVSSLAGNGNDTHRMTISAPLPEGNAGAPLINMNAQVVGTVARDDDAVKSAYIAALLAGLPILNVGDPVRVKPGSSVETVAAKVRKTIYQLIAQ